MTLQGTATAIGIAFLGGAFLAWGIVRGAAKLRTPEEQERLDDEQARILAEMREKKEAELA